MLLITAEVPPLVAMRVAPKTVKPEFEVVSLAASMIRTLPLCWFERRTRFLIPLVGMLVTPGGVGLPQPAIHNVDNAITVFSNKGLNDFTLIKTALMDMLEIITEGFFGPETVEF